MAAWRINLALTVVNIAMAVVLWLLMMLPFYDLADALAKRQVELSPEITETLSGVFSVGRYLLIPLAVGMGLKERLRSVRLKLAINAAVMVVIILALAWLYIAMLGAYLAGASQP